MASHPLHVASDEPDVSSNTGNVASRVGLNADAAATPWEIFCLVVGEDIPSLIEVQSNATVYKLKKAIKAEKAKFASIDADSLTLFKVDVPAQDMGKALEEIAALESSKEMHPLFELREYYVTAPPKKTIHILVRTPYTLSDSPIVARGITIKGNEVAEALSFAKRARHQKGQGPLNL
jgi:hypothetical protein